MSKYEKVTLFTVPSTHIRADLPPTKTPYKQVVGVRIGERVALSSVSKYDEQQIVQSEHELPVVACQRVGEYFVRHFEEGVAGSPEDTRNCFHFGVFTALGIMLPSRQAATDLVYREARYTPLLNDAPVPGELSVIRYTEDLATEPVLHLVVKIDDDEDTYLRVMTRGGNMGISSIADALAYRRTPEYRARSAEYHSIDNQNWDVGHFTVSSALHAVYPG